jgi:hypothetical protein
MTSLVATMTYAGPDSTDVPYPSRALASARPRSASGFELGDLERARCSCDVHVGAVGELGRD